jgi:signal transduction histidine kinase
MLLPTSSEFLALCQAQLTVLTQSLGASLGIVYLTEEMGTNQETKLVPILSLPENINSIVPDGNILGIGMAPLALPGSEKISALVQPDRLVLPLMHEEMVLGLLVTERIDRAWTTLERQEIDQVVKTLSFACVLDQRSQWLTQRQQQQNQLQLQQHDLMDNLVHQFRNPLTALRTFGKLLLKRLPETDANREVAASIVRESDRLQELLLQIDRAVDLNEPLLEQVQLEKATTEAAALPMAGTLGEKELVLEPCDVRSILQPLLVSAVAVAQEKNLELHTEVPEVLPLVKVNPSALREVLSNLIDNAVKYTPANGEVHVRIEAVDKKVLFRVTDNGFGIPDEDLAKLFQRHFRGVQEKTEIPGTGLGLSIARELMQQMQGEIRAFSPMQPEGWIDGALPQNRGVTFLVTIPIV